MANTAGILVLQDTGRGLFLVRIGVPTGQFGDLTGYSSRVTAMARSGNARGWMTPPSRACSVR